MAKKVKVQPVLTRDERIALVLSNKITDNPVITGTSVMSEVPKLRYLKVGDEVEIGNLSNCVVCHVTDDQKFVVVDYSFINNNCGNPITTPSIGCWVWFEVYKKYNILNTSMTVKNGVPRHQYKNSTLACLLTKVLHWGVDDSPEYQRDYVWTDQDKFNLIDSIFNGRDIGKFVFLSYDYPRDEEVLDGKQRLNTLVQFYTSKFKYKNLYYHELCRWDRNTFEDYMVQFAELDAREFTEADKLKLFLSVNVAGVPQSEEHLTKIKDKLTKLTKQKK